MHIFTANLVEPKLCLDCKFTKFDKLVLGQKPGRKNRLADVKRSLLEADVVQLIASFRR